jgi:hypothetical protein
MGAARVLGTAVALLGGQRAFRVNLSLEAVKEGATGRCGARGRVGGLGPLDVSCKASAHDALGGSHALPVVRRRQGLKRYAHRASRGVLSTGCRDVGPGVATNCLGAAARSVGRLHRPWLNAVSGTLQVCIQTVKTLYVNRQRRRVESGYEHAN